MTQALTQQDTQWVRLWILMLHKSTFSTQAPAQRPGAFLMPEILILITLMAVFFGSIGAAYLLAEVFNILWRKSK